MTERKPVDRAGEAVEKTGEAVDELAQFKHDPMVREAMAIDRPAALAAVEQANYAIANADLRQPAMDTEE